MDKKTKKLALSALMASLGLVFLLGAALAPSGQLGFAAVASFFVAVTVTEAGVGFGAMVYAVTALLGFLLSGDKATPLLYIVFFGYYPVLKTGLEKLPKVISWVLKIVFCLVVIFFVLRFAGFALSGSGLLKINNLLLYALAVPVFVLYDIGFTKLWKYYRLSLAPRFHRRG